MECSLDVAIRQDRRSSLKISIKSTFRPSIVEESDGAGCTVRQPPRPNNTVPVIASVHISDTSAHNCSSPVIHTPVQGSCYEGVPSEVSSAASSELNAFKSSLIHQAEVLKDSVQSCCLDSPTSYWSLDLENSVFCSCKCPVPECSSAGGRHEPNQVGISIGHERKVFPALKSSRSDSNMMRGKRSQTSSHNKIIENV